MHVKQPLSVRSRVCHRKAILALLDQLTTFGQRESLTIHASSGSGRVSAVISGQSVKRLQSIAARWRCTKWLGNRKFPGGHPSNYLLSQTLLNFNDYMTCTLSKVIHIYVIEVKTSCVLVLVRLFHSKAEACVNFDMSTIEPQ